MIKPHFWPRIDFFSSGSEASRRLSWFKTFSTCSSHILAVAVFYGSAAFMYLQPSSVSFIDEGKVSCLFYTIVVSILNPLIYSQQNRDVNVALKKTLVGRTFFWSEIIGEWFFSLHNWQFYCVSLYFILAHMSIYIYQHISIHLVALYWQYFIFIWPVMPFVSEFFLS